MKFKETKMLFKIRNKSGTLKNPVDVLKVTGLLCIFTFLAC